MDSRETTRQRRSYRMAQRADGARARRDLIVRAAVALHGGRGVAGTSWAAIADRAGVSTATVYRHFPDLEALVPACAQFAFEAGARLPTQEELAQAFSGLLTAAERLRRLIAESCACYERAEEWLAACRRDAHGVPALAQAVLTQERALEDLIDAALGGALEPTRKAAMRALLDFPFWKSLVDAGVPRRDAPAVIAGLAQSVLGPNPGGGT